MLIRNSDGTRSERNDNREKGERGYGKGTGGNGKGVVEKKNIKFQRLEGFEPL